MRKCRFDYKNVKIEELSEDKVKVMDNFSCFMTFCFKKQKNENLYYVFREDMKTSENEVHRNLVKKAFEYFLDVFVSKVIGHFRYKKESKDMVISEFVTVADEVWAYIVLEANFANWQEWEEKKRLHLEHSKGNSKFQMRPKFRKNREKNKDVFSKSTWDSRTTATYYNEGIDLWRKKDWPKNLLLLKSII